MKNQLEKIVNAIKNNIILFILALIVYFLMLILGVSNGFTKDSSEIFIKYARFFYINILSIDVSVIKFLIIRILNAMLLFAICFLLSLNKYTNFLIVFLVGYRGFILGIALKSFIISFKLLGIIIFIFCVFLQNFITSVSAIILMCLNNDYYNEQCCDNKIEKLLKNTIISIIISFFGIILEFVILVFFIRPLHFYF